MECKRRLAIASKTSPSSKELAQTLREIDSQVYDNKVRINHWHDTMMEHKKIYYAAELKMYKLELALASCDTSNKSRWSVRHREVINPLRERHEAEEKEAAEKSKRIREPGYGYVPLGRQLAGQQDDEKDVRGDEENNDTGYVVSADEHVRKMDGHSEDYQPFRSTASLHSYMYLLRKVYGK